jgi:hypothetical protein
MNWVCALGEIYFNETRIIMHRDHKIFIQAIKDKKKVIIEQLNDSDREKRTKVCRPLFYIPASSQDGCAHYYFWDGERGEKGNIFWVTPAQIVSIEPTQQSFDPSGFTLMSDEELPRRDSQSPDSLEHAR